jgi:hypothetical protein
MQNVTHYTRLHTMGATTKVPSSFVRLVQEATRNDFRDGKVLTRGDAKCWPVGENIFVYIEGLRFGFLSTGSAVSNMALKPVSAKYYMTREANPSKSQGYARLSTTEEARIVRAAANHDFSNNMVYQTNNMFVVPLGHNRFTYCDATDFGYFFKPPCTFGKNHPQNH